MTLHFPVVIAAVVAVASLGVPLPDRGDRTGSVQAQAAAAGHDQAALDARVKRFLAERARSWRDMNVPASDGQLLHDLIVEHGYTRALEIGTSTGHSGIWIAWALSRTGGRLITVEIDERRHRQALANFEAAGLSEFIDARLGNAHEIVPALEGPFDFVFSDADKDWYPNYFKAVFPKLTIGGCYTTHNITERGRGAAGSRDYLALLRGTPGAETTVDERGGGMAITFKRAAGTKWNLCVRRLVQALAVSTANEERI